MGLGDASPNLFYFDLFQLINRQAVAIDPDSGDPTYLAAWAAAFPGRVFNGEAGDGSWSPVTYQPGTIIPEIGRAPCREGDYHKADAAGSTARMQAYVK